MFHVALGRATVLPLCRVCLVCRGNVEKAQYNEVYHMFACLKRSCQYCGAVNFALSMRARMLNLIYPLLSAFDLSNTLLVPSVTSSFIPNAVNVLTYCHAQVGVCERGGGAGREPKRGTDTWRVS